jgi:hypothetical protein
MHQASRLASPAAATPVSVEASLASGGIEPHLLRRIKSEFLEMPGLRLTAPQAKRLWGMDDVSCSALLAALVASGFLFQTRDGAFMRIERAHVVPVKTLPAVA